MRDDVSQPPTRKPPRAVQRWALVALLALGAAGAGPAAWADGPLSPGFEGVDADGDGAIDADEWDRYGDSLFEGVDQDGDGLASEDELQQSFDSFDLGGDGAIDGGESPLVVILGDADGDGRVTPEEFEIIDWNRASLDRDGDGAIGRDEFRRARRDIYDRADFDRSLTLNRSEYQGAPSLTLFRF